MGGACCIFLRFSAAEIHPPTVQRTLEDGEIQVVQTAVIGAGSPPVVAHRCDRGAGDVCAMITACRPGSTPDLTDAFPSWLVPASLTPVVVRVAHGSFGPAAARRPPAV